MLRIESLISGTTGSCSHSSGPKVGRGVRLGLGVEETRVADKVSDAVVAFLVPVVGMALVLVGLGVLSIVSVGPIIDVDEFAFGRVAPIDGIGATLV